jgi:Flp pilus assembly pilin Flp
VIDGTYLQRMEETVKKTVTRIVQDTRGSEFIEYILIAGVVALLAVAAFTTFGADIQAKIQAEGAAVTAIQQ